MSCQFKSRFLRCNSLGIQTTYLFVLARHVESKLLAFFGLHHLVLSEHDEHEVVELEHVLFVRVILDGQSVVDVGQENVVL